MSTKIKKEPIINHYTLRQYHDTVNDIVRLLSEPFTNECQYIKIDFEYKENNPFVEIGIDRNEIEVIINFYDSETINVSVYSNFTGRRLQRDFKQFDTDMLGEELTHYLDDMVGVKYDS